MQHAYLSLSMPLPNIIKIYQSSKKLLSAREFGLEIRSGEITRKEQELHLYVILLHDLIYVPTQCFQISNSMGVLTCTRFRL